MLGSSFILWIFQNYSVLLQYPNILFSMFQYPNILFSNCFSPDMTICIFIWWIPFYTILHIFLTFLYKIWLCTLHRLWNTFISAMTKNFMNSHLPIPLVLKLLNDIGCTIYSFSMLVPIWLLFSSKPFNTLDLKKIILVSAFFQIDMNYFGDYFLMYIS